LEDPSSSKHIRGVFTVQPNKLFASSKVVIWQQFMGSAYVLISEEENANIHLAANCLCVFLSAMVEHFGNFNIFTSPSQIFHRPEDVFILLDKFLPNGQLSYIRGPMVRRLLEEARSLLQMKSLITNAKIATKIALQ